MKTDSIRKPGIIAAAFLCLLTLIVHPASALTITDSSSFKNVLNDGAYITNNSADSSLFNKEILSISADRNGYGSGSGSIAFSAIPYFSFESSLYFEFIFDMQETGGSGIGGRQINIDDIVVSYSHESDPTSLIQRWEYAQSIILNSSAEKPFTGTPLNAGGDMALYVPVALFNGLELTGSDLLTLTVTQSNSNNGSDEWVVLGSGKFFCPECTINDPPIGVPEPSAVLLLGIGLVGLVVFAGVRRKFKN